MSYRSILQFGISAVLLLAAAQAAYARMVYWGTGGDVDFRNSHGGTWTEDQRVSLGVFRNGFTPSWVNREDWYANWVELAVAVYDAEEKRFAGAVDGSAPLPLGYAGQVYLWAADGLDLSVGPDWLLASHSDWQWPGVGASSGLPALVWTTGDDDAVVTGAISDGGMRLASVDMWPVPEAPSAWFLRELGRAPDRQAWMTDDDGDGLNNLREYAAGTNPKNCASVFIPKFRIETQSEERWWTLELDRSPHAAVLWKLEVSTDLSKWTEPATAPEVLVDRADKWIARGRLPLTGEAGFFRFRQEIEENESLASS